MSGRTPLKVAVLMGGISRERDVSLVTGRGVGAALRACGFQVREIDAGRDLATTLEADPPNVVFNALHGRWGEDGCVQGILEWLQIPYTHSGVLSSALAMNKERAKAVFRTVGLPVAESVIVDSGIARNRHPMSPPYVVKPVNEGSSVGVYLVMEMANGPARLDDDAPDQVMVERYVPGRELTVSVMHDRALAVTEIRTDGWYNYHAKYAPGGSRHLVPAPIPEDIAGACVDFAVRAHKSLHCRGVSRTDLRWDDSRGPEGLVVLETNTQPGMTPTSLVPEQAAHVGIGFDDLVRWMVEDASCDR